MRCLRIAAALSALIPASCGAPLPPYDQGFRDGCLTGYSDAGRPGYGGTFVKDERRFATDADYRRGWAEGDKSCYDDEMRSPHMGGMS